MKKKILIIRNAREHIFKRLYDEIRTDYEIDCFIQPRAIDDFEIKYPDINFISIERDGIYNYLEEDNKKIAKKDYDKVFLLSGVHFFKDQYEFYSLLKNNNFLRKAYGFNIYGDYIYLGRKYNRLKYESEFFCNIFNFIEFMISKISFIKKLL